jgi:23S rRNA C2498 (ribose-2'-O)-methylase RlmM
MAEHVPEHRQFTDMMHDIYAYTQRERQIERVNCDAAESPKKILDLTNLLNQLLCKSSQVGIFTLVADHRSDTRSV